MRPLRVASMLAPAATRPEAPTCDRKGWLSSFRLFSRQPGEQHISFSPCAADDRNQVGRRAVVGGAWLGGRGVVARGAMRNRHRTSAPDGSPPTPAGQAWPPPSYVPSATKDLALQWDHVWRRKV